MDSIAPSDCLWCGRPIPDERRGHGQPPKTCSEACRKARASARESARYQTVKNTAAWREGRAAYLAARKRELASDPALLAAERARSAAATAKWASKLQAEAPERAAAIAAYKRAERAEKRRQLESSPEQWEAYKARCRAWYAALPEGEKERIFKSPRRARNLGLP